MHAAYRGASAQEGRASGEHVNVRPTAIVTWRDLEAEAAVESKDSGKRPSSTQGGGVMHATNEIEYS